MSYVIDYDYLNLEVTVEEKELDGTDVPLGQRLFDRPFLLLVAGMIVMFGFYTIWGWIDMASLPQATLP